MNPPPQSNTFMSLSLSTYGCVIGERLNWPVWIIYRHCQVCSYPSAVVMGCVDAAWKCVFVCNIIPFTWIFLLFFYRDIFFYRLFAVLLSFERVCREKKADQRECSFQVGLFHRVSVRAAWYRRCTARPWADITMSFHPTCVIHQSTAHLRVKLFCFLMRMEWRERRAERERRWSERKWEREKEDAEKERETERKWERERKKIEKERETEWKG